MSEDELPISAASCSRCYSSMRPRKGKQFCESCWSKYTEQCRGIKKDHGAAKRASCICWHDDHRCQCGRALCEWEAKHGSMCTMCVNDHHGSSRSPNAQSDSGERTDDELPEHLRLPTNSQALRATKDRTVQRKINQHFGVKVGLKHFSKHTSEEMEQVVANGDEVAADIRKCSTCRASKPRECFLQGAFSMGIYSA